MNLPELFEQRQNLMAVAKTGDWPDEAMDFIADGLGVLEEQIERQSARSGADMTAKLQLLAEYASDDTSVYSRAPDMLRRVADEWESINRQMSGRAA